jgi:hypothetical protein
MHLSYVMTTHLETPSRADQHRIYLRALVIALALLAFSVIVALAATYPPIARG